MRRAVATLLVLTAVVVGGTSVGSGSTAAAAVGRFRPAKVKCRHARERAIDVLSSDSDGRVLLPGKAKALRLQLATLGKRKRRDFLHDLASAAVVMCRQKAGGVPWTADAAKTYSVPSEAMTPTIKVGDRILVNLDAYKSREPKRGEILVHRPPSAIATSPARNAAIVSRLIGLPGETIEGRDGKVLINGQPLDEPYLGRKVESRIFGPVQIPAGTYYVLGDHRLYSKDSNFYGPIARQDLIGPAVVL
jgi:signal peptidase I